MRILPILFNTDMVRAILDGRKTVTRRLIKAPVLSKVEPPKKVNLKNGVANFEWNTPKTAGGFEIKMPYQPGDILYVRECGIIQSMKNFDKTVKMYFPADDTLIEFKVTPDEYERLSRFPEDKKLSPYWLTKQESRIWLKVKDVRVERLKDMTDKDALKEGAQGVECDHAGLGVYGCTDCMNTGWLEPAILEFMGIWNSTIKKSDLDSYGWDANPWVWVIEFERCEKPEDF